MADGNHPGVGGLPRAPTVTESQAVPSTPATTAPRRRSDAQWRNRMSQGTRRTLLRPKALRRQQETSDASRGRQEQGSRTATARRDERDRPCGRANKQLAPATTGSERLGRVGGGPCKAKLPRHRPRIRRRILAAMDEGRLADLNARLATAQTTASRHSLIPTRQRVQAGFQRWSLRRSLLMTFKADLERTDPVLGTEG